MCNKTQQQNAHCKFQIVCFGKCFFERTLSAFSGRHLVRPDIAALLAGAQSSQSFWSRDQGILLRAKMITYLRTRDLWILHLFFLEEGYQE